MAVIIDLLMPREAKFKRNKPPLLANFAVQKADGAGVAMRSFVEHRIDGTMPDGRRNTVELRVASIPALLVMKGYALVGRDKGKDAYDIYFSVREFEGGPDALADACRPRLDDPVALAGFKHIAGKSIRYLGPRLDRTLDVNLQWGNGSPGPGHQRSFATRSKTRPRHAGKGQLSGDELGRRFASTRPEAAARAGRRKATFTAPPGRSGP